MGIEHWEEETIQAYMRQRAQEWFDQLLNPLHRPYGTPFRHSTIRSFVEIDPHVLKLPRWPKRAWSVVADVEGDQNIGMLIGTWYDHNDFVDLLEFHPLLRCLLDTPVEELHRELLDSFNSLAKLPKKPMSQARRKRWSQLDYKHFAK